MRSQQSFVMGKFHNSKTYRCESVPRLGADQSTQATCFEGSRRQTTVDGTSGDAVVSHLPIFRTAGDIRVANMHKDKLVKVSRQMLD